MRRLHWSCALAALALWTSGCAADVAAQERARGVPSSWQACEASSDCVLIEHQCCAYTPVHRRHAAAARRRLPPSTCDMICEGGHRAQCRASRCVRVRAPAGSSPAP
ncbi:MAG: hypothetical protein KF729_19610 [Sandaracinaceae bacterium]|nr:hypothetical protein [Sandaracinaceae bacterium]